MEHQLLDLASAHARLVESHRLARRQLSAVGNGTPLLCDNCGGDALRLAEATEAVLEETAAGMEEQVERGREEAGVAEKKKKVERVSRDVEEGLRGAMERGDLVVGRPR